MSRLPLYADEVEYELKQSRESLEFALESGHMGTWEVDLKTNKIICSNVMLQLWGMILIHLQAIDPSF